MIMHCMRLSVAGVNPQSVRGTSTGVYVGCVGFEAHVVWGGNSETMTGYEMQGCARSMLANRLSYFFDFKGSAEINIKYCLILNIILNILNIKYQNINVDMT